MTVKIGIAEGTCPKCGKTLRRRRPSDFAVCDCYEYCPSCGSKMQPFIQDLTPSTYQSDEINVLMYCSSCDYKSTQKPVEVRLS